MTRTKDPYAPTFFRTYLDGWWTLREIVIKGEDFSNKPGTFEGHPGTEWASTASGRLVDPGQLSEANELHYLADAGVGGVIYTVTSYKTIIGWQRTDGSWVVPDVVYSVTTSRHQALLRTVVAEIVADQPA